MDEVSRDRWMSRRAWKHILAEPKLFLRACVWRIVRLWDIAPRGPETAQLSRLVIGGIACYYSVILIGFLVGMAGLRHGAWAAWSPVIAVVASVTLVHAIYWTDMRMRAPVIPAIALLAARGWGWLAPCIHHGTR
jgi:hypothetical protein